MDNKEIGILIRTVRRLHDIPQARIASLIGRSQMYVSRVEHGILSLTDEERRKIEKFLHLDTIRRVQAQVLDLAPQLQEKRHAARRR